MNLHIEDFLLGGCSKKWLLTIFSVATGSAQSNVTNLIPSILVYVCYVFFNCVYHSRTRVSTTVLTLPDLNLADPIEVGATFD